MNCVPGSCDKDDVCGTDLNWIDEDDVLIKSEERETAERTKAFLVIAIRSLISKLPEEFTVAEEVLKRLRDDDEYVSSHFLPRMKFLPLPEGIDVVVQGEVDTNLYIVESGTLSVTVFGNEVRTMGKGDIFGEIALLYETPRSATVTCVGHCNLWCLDRLTFFEALNKDKGADMELMRTKRFSCLKEVSGLQFDLLKKLVSGMKTETVPIGHVLCAEGKCTTRTVLIEEGCVEIEIPEEHRNLPDVKLDEMLGINRTHSVTRGLKPASESVSVPFGSTADEILGGGPLHHRPTVKTSASISEDALFSLPSIGSPNATANGISKIDLKFRSPLPSHRPAPTIRLSEGCIIGTGVMASKMMIAGSWSWKDEIVEGVPSVGAVSPCTAIVTSSTAKIAYFTVAAFELLFGPASVCYFFPNRELVSYFRAINEPVELPPRKSLSKHTIVTAGNIVLKLIRQGKIAAKKVAIAAANAEAAVGAADEAEAEAIVKAHLAADNGAKTTKEGGTVNSTVKSSPGKNDAGALKARSLISTIMGSSSSGGGSASPSRRGSANHLRGNTKSPTPNRRSISGKSTPVSSRPSSPKESGSKSILSVMAGHLVRGITQGVGNDKSDNKTNARTITPCKDDHHSTRRRAEAAANESSSHHRANGVLDESRSHRKVITTSKETPSKSTHRSSTSSRTPPSSIAPDAGVSLEPGVVVSSHVSDTAGGAHDVVSYTHEETAVKLPVLSGSAGATSSDGEPHNRRRSNDEIHCSLRRAVTSSTVIPTPTVTDRSTPNASSAVSSNRGVNVIQRALTTTNAPDGTLSRHTTAPSSPAVRLKPLATHTSNGVVRDNHSLTSAASLPVTPLGAAADDISLSTFTPKNVGAPVRQTKTTRRSFASTATNGRANTADSGNRRKSVANVHRDKNGCVARPTTLEPLLADETESTDAPMLSDLKKALAQMEMRRVAAGLAPLPAAATPTAAGVIDQKNAHDDVCDPLRVIYSSSSSDLPIPILDSHSHDSGTASATNLEKANAVEALLHESDNSFSNLHSLVRHSSAAVESLTDI